MPTYLRCVLWVPVFLPKETTDNVETKKPMKLEERAFLSSGLNAFCMFTLVRPNCNPCLNVIQS